MIHPTAIVHPSAEVAADVQIGEYSIIGASVKVGPGSRIGPFVVIDGWTEIGEKCEIYAGAVIGTEPQDFKYGGEQTTVRIGDRNVIREYVTINRGSEGGETRIGNGNLIMAYAHIGHNCSIGNEVTISNACGLSGHVAVEDKAVLGGMAGIHQFVRIGSLAMVGGYTKIVQDVPPYLLVEGQPARVCGINSKGLRRHAISAQVRKELKHAYRIFYRSGLTVSQALEEIDSNLNASQELTYLLGFLRNPTRRGILRRGSSSFGHSARTTGHAAFSGPSELCSLNLESK
ncbi:MAG: acyl-ACP--UDP-N-acetylglucosamine O-acyltransferase [Armatimonadetes bacterium]|nr:acyl-ACP--UDP-N-acetylglucosamine O-acyltransferase [Armatimonadota bacterium]